MTEETKAPEPQEAEITVVVEEKPEAPAKADPAPAEPAKEEAAPAEPETQEQGEDAPKPRKRKSAEDRIREMTYAQREAERQRDEAINAARTVMARSQLMSAAHIAQALDARISEAARIHQEALNSGDAEKATKCATDLAGFVAQRENLKNWVRQNAPQMQQQGQQPRPQPQQQAPKAPPAPIRDWLSKNPWYGQDQAMTAVAQKIDTDLTALGYDPNTEEYTQELDRRLRPEFPHKFQQPPAGPSRTAPSPVGGVSRTGGARPTTQVSLTASQVEVAKRLGITPQQYAAEFIKLENRT